MKNLLYRLNFVVLLCSIGFSSWAQLGISPVKSIKLAGYLGKRVDQCIELQTKTQDLDELIAPFTKQNETKLWQSEFLGKWIVAAVASYRYTNDPVLLKKIQYAADGLMKNQLPNGYIGNYPPEAQLQGWDVWGRKASLYGLIAYYDITADKNALQSAQRLIDHLLTQVGTGTGVDIVNTGAHRGMPSITIIEPVILLYNRTKEQRYLDFANSIMKSVETADGPQLISKAISGVPVSKRFPFPKPWFGRGNGSKAYEMMECYLSMLELYKIANNTVYLYAAERTAASIIEDEITIVGTGGAGESWVGGKKKQTIPTFSMMETCDASTLVRFFYRLLQLTGNSIYADLFEKNIYNALMAPLKQDGTQIAQYTPIEGCRHKATGQCNMSLTCCWGSLQRTYGMLPELVYQVTDDKINVNLYIASKATIALNKNQTLWIEQKTEYPTTDKVEFEIGLQKEANFVLALRIPAWSEKVSIEVNGQDVTNTIIRGAYYPITRKWKNGDKITLTLDLRAKVIEMNNHQAIVRGPVVFARDSRFNDGDVDEACFFVQKDGYVELTPVSNKSADTWMEFTAPLVLGTFKKQPSPIHFCDYASACEKWDSPERYRVWLQKTLDVTIEPTESDTE